MAVGADMALRFAHSEHHFNRYVRCQRDDMRSSFSQTLPMGDDQKSFGANLKAARLAKGWSQQELADAAETSKGYISDLERSERPIPPGAFLDRLTGALGIPLVTLIGSDGSVRSVPIISDVAAGRLTDPSIPIEEAYRTIEIGGLPPGDYFATRVSGDSMDRLSPDGSLILVNRAEREPLAGKRYIFGRRGQTTYKRFETEPLRLVPESTNPLHEPIYPRSEEEWVIIGRVRLTLKDDL